MYRMNLARCLQQKICEAQAANGEYYLEYQLPINGVITTFTSTATSVVNFVTKTSVFATESINAGSTRKETIFFSNNMQQTVREEGIDPVIERSENALFPPRLYDQMFEKNGDMTPVDVSQLIPVSCDSIGGCQKFKFSPKRSGVIPGFIDADVTICQKDCNVFEVTFIISALDPIVGEVLTNTSVALVTLS